MTTPMEDRLQHALTVQAQRVPVDVPPPWRAKGGRRDHGRRRAWRPIVAVGTVVVAVVVVVLVIRSSDTQPGSTVVAGQPTAPDATPGLQSTPLATDQLPVVPGPRPVLAEVETVAANPIERASMAFYAGRSGADTRSSWFVVDARTQTLRAVADLPATGAGDLTPDGTALVVVQPLGDRSAILITDLRTGRRSGYTRDAAVRTAVWSPSGSRLALIERTNAERNLWRMTVLERDGSLVASAGVVEGEHGSSVGWSAAGSKVAMLGCESLGACPGAVLDVARNALRRTSQPVRWIGWVDDSHLVAERPFGGALVTDTDGEVQREITGDGRPAGPRAVSSDGKSLLMLPFSSGMGQTFVRVVDLDTGATTRELIAPEGGVPSVIGWRGKDVLVVRERTGGLEVVPAESRVLVGNEILVLPFRGEGFSTGLVLAAWFSGGRG
jgi:hypothetical protein